MKNKFKTDRVKGSFFYCWLTFVFMFRGLAHHIMCLMLFVIHIENYFRIIKVMWKWWRELLNLALGGWLAGAAPASSAPREMRASVARQIWAWRRRKHILSATLLEMIPETQSARGKMSLCAAKWNQALLVWRRGAQRRKQCVAISRDVRKDMISHHRTHSVPRTQHPRQWHRWGKHLSTAASTCTPTQFDVSSKLFSIAGFSFCWMRNLNFIYEKFETFSVIFFS